MYGLWGMHMEERSHFTQSMAATVEQLVSNFRTFSDYTLSAMVLNEA